MTLVEGLHIVEAETHTEKLGSKWSTRRLKLAVPASSRSPRILKESDVTKTSVAPRSGSCQWLGRG